MNRWIALASRGFLLALLVAAFPACDRYGAYCTEKMDCEGGNDMDVDACIAEAEQAEDEASLWDCDEWFDAMFDCVEQKSSCSHDHYSIDNNDCESELEDYSSCM